MRDGVGGDGLRRPGRPDQNRCVPADLPSPPRRGRVEPRETAELRRLRAEHPELASAVDMQIGLVDLERRIHSRLRTPLIRHDEAALRRRLQSGRRLVDFDDLLIDWSEFRLILRQTAELLHRAGAIEGADHDRIQALVRAGDRVESLARDYYERTASPAEYAPPPPAEPAMLDEALSLSLRPFLARCAEAWLPRLTLDQWQRGYCPLCGMTPELAALVEGDRLLICGRCTVQWPYPSAACAFCGASEPGDITSFSSRDGRYRVYGCNRCRKYLKAYDARGASRPVMPTVDTIATLPLDAAAIQQGYDG
jgi:hypothetical protein